MLSPKQYKAIEAHFTCNTVAEIARKTGVHPQTIWGWRKQQEFSEELEKQKIEFDKAFSRRLARIAGKSLTQLESFIVEKSESSVLKTVEFFLKSKAMDDADEIKRRIYELEKLARERANERFSDVKKVR